MPKPKPQPDAQAKFDAEVEQLRKECRSGNAEAVADLGRFGPPGTDVTAPTLSQVRHAVATRYGVPTWERLQQACQMVSALHEGNLGEVQTLIGGHPELLHEDARGVDSNWGPPMSYAANLGQDDIIRWLAENGAKGFQHALDRACLQGRLETARLLMDYGATIERGMVMGCCETLCYEGLNLLLELGAEWCDENGDRSAPLAMLLRTYTRNPIGKHGCLILAEEQGVVLPDTPAMAVHRGRFDLLQRLYDRDQSIISRTYSLREIYPPEAGCCDNISFGLHGTPLEGATLLHMCVDFDEYEIAEWLIDKGVDVNAPADVDEDGFGGHTPLFSAVVSQAYLNGRQRDALFAKLLLDAGADPSVRASVRKGILFSEDESIHEYRDVTAKQYGDQFHDRAFVNPSVLALL